VTYVGKVAKSVLPRTSCFRMFSLKTKVRLITLPCRLSQSICVFPNNNFWTNWQISMKFSSEVMPLNVILMPYLLTHNFNHSKMDIQTSEVDAKPVPVNVGPWRFICWHIFKGWINFNNTFFVKSRKVETWKVVEI
jgi:hypothetical protein